jgi:proline iminopeptidase
LLFSNELYVKTFGNKSDKAMIFLHGGPGYNCSNFEVLAAEELSKSGFFVITYDRRGEGRSLDKDAKFTFQESYDDINYIYKMYNLTKASLIGHSFGGILATMYAENNADKVESIFYVGAPISLQETFKNIIARVKVIYTEKKDETNLKYVNMLETMDTTNIQYSSYCFVHAMQNGFYTPKKPKDEAKALYANFATDPILKANASQMTYPAPQGFWKNESYTTIDLYNNIEILKAKNIKLFGLYGKEDGLFSEAQVMKLKDIIGENNLLYLDNCSHNVFVDQRAEFIKAIKSWGE